MKEMFVSKSWIIAGAGILLLLIVLAVVPLYEKWEQSKEIDAVDGLVYTFIVGKVEGNDDLLASILTKKAQGIIVPGRHAFPGAADEMGDRYSIVRYERQYENNILLYRVEFYRPYTDKVDFYNVVVVNKGEGWKIAKNSSIDNQVMAQMIAEEEAVVVHEWER